MGTKYPSKSITGYNASPPADDGSAVEANRLKWANHKLKLGDPLKTLSESMNTAMVEYVDQGTIDKAVNFTTTVAEHKKTINVTAGVTISLGDAATMAISYEVAVKNSHSAAITVDLATGADTLDGSAGGSVSLLPDQAVIFVTNSAADGFKIKGKSLPPVVVATDTTDSTSGATGAMRSAGGIGAVKDIVSDANIKAKGVTDASSSTTGALQSAGGLGVAKAAHVGTTLKVEGISTFGDAIVSDADNADDIGTTAVRWKKAWLYDISIANGLPLTELKPVTVGDVDIEAPFQVTNVGAWPTFTKLKEIVMHQAGTIRVNHTIRAASTQYTRVYLNSVEEGPERTSAGSYSDDVVVAVGDLVQIYGNCSSDSCGANDKLDDVSISTSDGVLLASAWR